MVGEMVAKCVLEFVVAICVKVDEGDSVGVENGVASGKGFLVIGSTFISRLPITIGLFRVAGVSSGLFPKPVNHFLQPLRLAVAPLGFGSNVLDMFEKREHGWVRWLGRFGRFELGSDGVGFKLGLAVSGGFLGLIFIKASGFDETPFYAFRQAAP